MPEHQKKKKKGLSIFERCHGIDRHTRIDWIKGRETPVEISPLQSVNIPSLGFLNKKQTEQWLNTVVINFDKGISHIQLCKYENIVFSLMQ